MDGNRKEGRKKETGERKKGEGKGQDFPMSSYLRLLLIFSPGGCGISIIGVLNRASALELARAEKSK